MIQNYEIKGSLQGGREKKELGPFMLLVVRE